MSPVVRSAARTAYQILGVAKDASDEEIKTAYRRLARQTHPDVHFGSSAANEAFIEVKTAYDILSDPERRKSYDEDPDGIFRSALDRERRAAQLKRRRGRLRRLYEER